LEGLFGLLSNLSAFGAARADSLANQSDQSDDFVRVSPTDIGGMPRKQPALLLRV
jgi:hypothetical protein